MGENLVPDLLTVLLRFRQLPIVICADIEKAYLQYEIVPEHRTFLRFLWPAGIGKNSKAPMKEFQSCRLSFGILVSSPWLHCAGIRYHLENEIERNRQHRKLLEFIKDNFYVDDIIAPANDVEEGKAVVKTMVKVFEAGCFLLKKFATGTPEIGRFIKQLPSSNNTSAEWASSVVVRGGETLENTSELIWIFIEVQHFSSFSFLQLLRGCLFVKNANGDASARGRLVA